MRTEKADPGIIRLRADDSALADRVMIWRNIMRPTGNVEIDGDVPVPDFAANLDGKIIGELMAVRVTCASHSVRRDAGWIASAEDDIVFLNYQESGYTQGRYAGRAVAVEPGALLITRLLNEMDLKISGTWTGLLVPKRLLDRHLIWQKSLDGRLMAPGSVPAILLRNHIEALLDLGPLTPRESARVRHATLSLLAICLGGRELRREPDCDDEDLARQVRYFIVERLRDPRLSASTICQEFGISAAKLKRSLGKGFRLAARIRNFRLHNAYLDILMDNSRERTLKQIAAYWALGDERSFRRSFDRRFGFSPSQLRERALKGSSRSDSVLQSKALLRWFQLL